MSNKKYIEESFRAKFDNSGVSNQGWNEPSDSVWDRIDSELTNDNKNRSGYLHYLLIAGFLMTLIGLGYSMNQNNNLKNTIKDIQVELQNCSEQESKTNSLPIIISQSLEVEDKSFNRNKSNLTEEDSKINEINNKLNSAIHNIRKEKMNDLDISIIKSVEDYSSNSYSKEFRNIGLQHDLPLINSPENNTKRDFVDISMISTSKAKSLKEIHSSLDNRNIPEILPIRTLKAKSLWSVSGGLGVNELRTSGSQMENLAELIDNEYAELGYSLDLKYTTPLTSNLSLSLGIGGSYQKFITEYDITLPYDTGNELIENGIGFIDFQHSLPTSFGNTETQLRLRRFNPNAVLEESNVNIDFNTQHELISVFVPITVDYLFGDISEGIFVGVDVLPSYIVSAKSGISSVVSKHSEIQSVNNRSVSEYETLQRVNLGLGGHIGYRYPFTENSGFELNAGYLRNIRAYFSTDSFSSRNHGVHLKAGYYFRF